MNLLEKLLLINYYLLEKFISKLLFIDKIFLSRMTNEFVRKINFMNSKKNN